MDPLEEKIIDDLGNKLRSDVVEASARVMSLLLACNVENAPVAVTSIVVPSIVALLYPIIGMVSLANKKTLVESTDIILGFVRESMLKNYTDASIRESFERFRREIGR